MRNSPLARSLALGTLLPLGIALVLSCEPAGGDPLWPRLNANIFSPILEVDEAYRALAAFDNVVLGGIHSTAALGGYDYGPRSGFGSFSSIVYDFSADTNGGQEAIYGTKRINPNVRFVAHHSLQKIELMAFEYGTTSPMRWSNDSLSPKWFAYTPLVPLREDASDTGAVSFQFDPADVARFVSWGAKGTQGVWPGGDRYAWTYLCFYDNDAGGGRGSFEIMAIRGLDPESGIITVARDRKGSRTCYGRPQTYSRGHRMGIVSHSWDLFGSPALAMNGTTLSERVPADPVHPEGPWIDWIEASRDYVRTICMPARKPASGPGAVSLCDGTLMDADDEDASRFYGFTMFRHDNWHVDLDLDGRVDGDLDGDGDADDLSIPSALLVEGYETYEKGLREDATGAGRPDFLILKNGVITTFPRELNGRRYEDLNAFFQDPSLPAAIDQYLAIEAPGNLVSPVLAIISERDRTGLPKEDYYAAHRSIMALTYVFGDGSYGHTGDHAFRHRTIIGNEEPDGTDDWLDELSVNGLGVGCNHPDYGPEPREKYSDWMGRALGPGREIDPVRKTYRRDFENAVALYTIQATSVDLGGTFQKILGGDDPAFSNGSIIAAIDLAERSGAILVRKK